jgi:hypothetical protein
VLHDTANAELHILASFAASDGAGRINDKQKVLQRIKRATGRDPEKRTSVVGHCAQATGVMPNGRLRFSEQIGPSASHRKKRRTMSENETRRSATIYQFPARPRINLQAQRNDAKQAELSSQPTPVAVSSGWYHAAAIDETKAS